jgi:hypothetical protein
MSNSAPPEALDAVDKWRAQTQTKSELLFAENGTDDNFALFNQPCR